VASTSPAPTASATPKPTPTPATLLSGRHALRSVDHPGRYVREADGLGVVSSYGATTFTFVAGLADSDCYSLRDSAGRYLRHYAFRARLDADDGSAIFKKDATFCARPGSVAGSVSLESYNYPGRYLRYRADFGLWLDPEQNTGTFRASRSFMAVAPLG
jgi:hypothetical protein